MGYSQHSGVVIVADGTDDAEARLRRVLWNDPGTGVMRHADAGYEIAVESAKENGLDFAYGCNYANRAGRTEMSHVLTFEPGQLTLAELRKVSREPVELSIPENAWAEVANCREDRGRCACAGPRCLRQSTPALVCSQIRVLSKINLQIYSAVLCFLMPRVWVNS